MTFRCRPNRGPGETVGLAKQPKWRTSLGICRFQRLVVIGDHIVTRSEMIPVLMARGAGQPAAGWAGPLDLGWNDLHLAEGGVTSRPFKQLNGIE